MLSGVGKLHSLQSLFEKLSDIIEPLNFEKKTIQTYDPGWLE